MSDSTNSVLHVALYRILRALAKVTLRYGMSVGAFTELVRRAHVDAAEEILQESDREPLPSRVCVLTGLYRKEVIRLKRLPPLKSEKFDVRYDRSARIISGWVRDPDFRTRSNRPAVLKIDAAKNSFSELVRRYGGDMTPHAVLEELIELNVVELTRTHRVKLLERAFVPSEDVCSALQVLGVDTEDLINTIAFNIRVTPEERRFQRKVIYVNIPKRHLELFRQYAATQSQALLEALDRWLAEHDAELSDKGASGARVGLGIYHTVSATTGKSLKVPQAESDGD
jgi:hypothetical protein